MLEIGQLPSKKRPKSTLLESILLTHFKPCRVDYCQSVALISYYSVYRNSNVDQSRHSYMMDYNQSTNCQGQLI